MFSTLSRSKILVALVAAVGCTAASAHTAHADVIASWDFTTNGSGFANGTAANTTAPGITDAVFTRNGTVSVNSATYSFDSKGFVAGTSADNVSVGFTTTGGSWDVTDLKFSAFGSNSGPGDVAVAMSVDGGAFTSLGTLTVGASAANFDLNLGGVTVTNSLNIIFYAADGVSVSGGTLGSSGTLRINNVGDSASTPVEIDGTAAAVPEPASLSLLGLGGVALLSRRRK